MVFFLCAVQMQPLEMRRYWMFSQLTIEVHCQRSLPILKVVCSLCSEVGIWVWKLGQEMGVQ